MGDMATSNLSSLVIRQVIYPYCLLTVIVGGEEQVAMRGVMPWPPIDSPKFERVALSGRFGLLSHKLAS